MGEDGPPVRLLREASLAVLPGEVRPREGQAWLVEWHRTRGVLRRLPQRYPSGLAVVVPRADVSWLHGFLERLAGLGFPSPRPLPCFGGRSWAEAQGALLRHHHPGFAGRGPRDTRLPARARASDDR